MQAVSFKQQVNHTHLISHIKPNDVIPTWSLESLQIVSHGVDIVHHLKWCEMSTMWTSYDQLCNFAMTQTQQFHRWLAWNRTNLDHRDIDSTANAHKCILRTDILWPKCTTVKHNIDSKQKKLQKLLAKALHPNLMAKCTVCRFASMHILTYKLQTTG